MEWWQLTFEVAFNKWLLSKISWGYSFEGFSETLHVLVSNYAWETRKSTAAENCLGDRSFMITPRSHNKFLLCRTWIVKVVLLCNNKEFLGGCQSSVLKRLIPCCWESLTHHAEGGSLIFCHTTWICQNTKREPKPSSIFTGGLKLGYKLSFLLFAMSFLNNPCY